MRVRRTWAEGRRPPRPVLLMVDGTSRHLSQFDTLKADQGCAATLERRPEELLSSHAVKQFFGAISWGRVWLLRRLLHELFVWRLRIEKPPVVVLDLASISHTLPAADGDMPIIAAFRPAAAPRDTRSTRRVVGPSGPSRRQATAWATTCCKHANAHAGPCGASDLSVRPPYGRCARSLPPPWSKAHIDRHLSALATKVCEKCGLYVLIFALFAALRFNSLLAAITSSHG